MRTRTDGSNIITLRVEIFAGIYFRESKINAFLGYLISQNQQKFAKLAKINTREN